VTDIFTTLEHDHRAVLDILAALEDMTASAAGQPTQMLVDRGGPLTRELIAAESRHEAAEEQYFWPTVKTKLPDGQRLAAHAVDQESEAKTVLAKLDGMSLDDERFMPLIQDFVKAARSHIEFEEQQVWPQLCPTLSMPERERLANKFARAKKMGPTHPHPHTLPNPAVLKTAGIAGAALDRGRDWLSSRR